MTAVLPIFILASLALFGAGLVPGVTPPMAVALLIAACLRPLPTQRSFRACVWLLLALAAWTLFTLAPASAWAGPWRTAAWADIQAFAARHGALCGLPASPSPVPRLSLHAGGSLRWLMLVLGAGGMFCVAASLRSRQRLVTVKALVVLGGVVAVAGLVGRQLFPSGAALVWWYPVAEIGGGEPFGPFVNRNHFAAFCALLAPLAVTLTCYSGGRFHDAEHGPDDAVDRMPLDVSPGERLLYGACLVALLVGVLCTRSRGGTAAMLLGLIVVTLLWLRRGPLAAALATLAGVGAILLVVLWPDAEFQGRLQGLNDAAAAVGSRGPIWLDSLRLWTHVPLAGSGANSFGMLFPQITSWATDRQATHAESDYLQLLAEGGVLGVLLVGALLGACCLPLLRALYPRRRSRRGADDEGNPVADDPGRSGVPVPDLGRRSDRRPTPTVADPMASGLAHTPSGQARSRSAPRPRPALPYPILAGIAGALAAVGLQSLVDIPLRVPLCAWTAAALAGLAAPPVSRPSTAPRSFSLLERLALAVLLAGSLCICWHTPGWRALYRDREAWLAEASTADIAALLTETPTYWQAWYEIGDRLCAQAASGPGPEADACRAAGLDAHRAAVRCKPRDPRLQGALAARLWAAEQWDEARLYRDAQIALLPADRGIRQQWLQAEWRIGAADQARQLVQRFVAAVPPDPAAADYLLWLAERELAEGSVVQARTALLAAAALRPDTVAILKGLAQCARRLDDATAEAESLQRLVQVSRADAATWWRLAEFARDRRDRQALQKALGMAVQIEPGRRRAADAVWKSFVQAETRQP
jgi:O-antigen ligase/tetratricopeptide (TPR) repeat protein